MGRILSSAGLILKTRWAAPVLSVAAGLLVLLLLRACSGCGPENNINGNLPTDAKGSVEVIVERHTDTVTVEKLIYRRIEVPVIQPVYRDSDRAVLDTMAFHSDSVVQLFHTEYNFDSNRFENTILAFSAPYREKIVNHYVDRTITVEIPKLVQVEDTDDWWWFAAGAATIAGGYIGLRHLLP